MKQNRNRMTKLITSTLVASTLATAWTIPAGATSDFYTGWISRGTKNLAYCKTVFSWQTDWRGNISKSTAYQVVSGINTNGGGAYQTYTHALEHGWTAITEYTMGLSYKGVGLGYVISYEDKVRLTNGGYLGVEWANK